MATKPPESPRWATAGIVVEPSEGKKDSGWLDAELPPAEEFNWFQNLTFQWVEYLREGKFRGPIRISADDDDNDPGVSGPGDLQMTGRLAVLGDVDINGATNMADTEFDGNVVVNGTLFSATRPRHGTARIHLPVSGAITGGFTGWVVAGATPPRWVSDGSLSTGGRLWFGIPFLFGGRLIGFDMNVRDTAGGGRLAARLVRVSGTNVYTVLSDDAESLGGGTYQTLSLDMPAPVNNFIAGNQYYVEIEALNSTTGGHAVLGGLASFDMPV